VGLHTFTDVSDESAVSIFRVETKCSTLLRNVSKLLPYYMKISRAGA